MALPDGERAELLNGHIYMMAPPTELHQRIAMGLSGRILNYILAGKGKCRVYAAPFGVFIKEDDKHYLEPDLLVVCDPEKIQGDGCHGAPDWVIEIVSPSNAFYDYAYKESAYQECGVRLYWIVDPRSRMVTIYDYENKDYSVKRFDEGIGTLYPDLLIKIADIVEMYDHA